LERDRSSLPNQRAEQSLPRQQRRANRHKEEHTMRHVKTKVAGLGAVAIITAAGCVPPGADPRIDNPAYCGQTTDGKAVVALLTDANLCTRLPGQKLVLVYDKCGPLMPGTIVEDDCWRGSIPGIGPDVFRLGTIKANGGTADVLVATDYTAY